MQTLTYLDCSTAHVTRADCLLFVDGIGGACAGHSEYGAFFSTWPDGFGGLRESGYSAAMVAVLAAAEKAGCTLVRFDADGALHAEFPTYEH